METIRNYIEVMFASLPQTEDVLQVKEDMLSNIEEKYHTMRASGITEDETVGKIIASIGSVNELRAEFGIEGEPERKAAAAPKVSQEIIDEYKAYTAKQHVYVAIAVAFFILSPCAYLFFDRFLGMDTISAVAFFAFIAIGVGLCIIAGRYDDYYENVFKLSDKEGKHGKNKYTSLFAAIIFPLATIVYLAIGFVWHLWHPGWVIFPICGILTGIIGAIEEFRQA